MVNALSSNSSTFISRMKYPPTGCFNHAGAHDVCSGAEVIMARRVARLTVDALRELPERVRSDLFWELSSVDRAGLDHEAAVEAKEAWLSRVVLEWGSCGRVVQVDDAPAGYVLYAPPRYFPGTAALPTAPLDEDAVQLATLEVFEPYAGAGLGRVLVQLMVKDLLTRGGLRSVECIGAHPSGAGRGLPVSVAPGGGPGEGTVLPVEFLQQVGFATQRPHPAYPRMRMDLRSVLTWRADLELAVERLVAAVRPRVPRPAPAPRTGE